ncbi:hypothetical protein DFH06DRAFT_1151696 [Mycena polygramma]|nr:hypothetical protein DFH06DRAFT_1151696 [Mycena polygramma]
MTGAMPRSALANFRRSALLWTPARMGSLARGWGGCVHVMVSRPVPLFSRSRFRLHLYEARGASDDALPLARGMMLPPKRAAMVMSEDEQGGIFGVLPVLISSTQCTVIPCPRTPTASYSFLLLTTTSVSLRHHPPTSCLRLDSTRSLANNLPQPSIWGALPILKKKFFRGSLRGSLLYCGPGESRKCCPARWGECDPSLVCDPRCVRKEGDAARSPPCMRVRRGCSKCARCEPDDCDLQEMRIRDTKHGTAAVRGGACIAHAGSSGSKQECGLWRQVHAGELRRDAPHSASTGFVEKLCSGCGESWRYSVFVAGERWYSPAPDVGKGGGMCGIGARQGIGGTGLHAAGIACPDGADHRVCASSMRRAERQLCASAAGGAGREIHGPGAHTQGVRLNAWMSLVWIPRRHREDILTVRIHPTAPARRAQGVCFWGRYVRTGAVC